jgi:molecular chaperone GrpE
MVGTDRSTEQETTQTAEDQRPPADTQVAESTAAAAPSSSVAEEAPVEALSAVDRLAAAEAEIARLKDDYLRALAEVENVRRRAARDRQEASQYAVSSFARDLLSVADNLQRALGSVAEEARMQDPALDALMSGVEMTEKELLTVLDRYGVKRIAADGETFDPHVHEALYEIPDASVPHGTVLQVVQPGYTIHDRTLRPARVGIARGGPKPGAQPAAEPKPTGTEPGADDTVVEFPKRTAGDPYRKPGDDGETAGTRVDETH